MKVGLPLARAAVNTTFTLKAVSTPFDDWATPVVLELKVTVRQRS